MENYIWVAIAAATSFTIFLTWVWRDGRLGDFPRRGVEGTVAVLVETAPALPVVRGD